MLKEILTVSGKPGLYRLKSRGRNSLIVESLDSAKKRFPVNGTDKVVSLGDISIFTEDGEIALRDVLFRIAEKREKAALEFNFRRASDAELGKYFEDILPGYDRERVYPSHIKKIFSWYDILVGQGINDFSEPKSEPETGSDAETPVEA